MDRETWCAVIHGVTKSPTRLRDWTELNWTVAQLVKNLPAMWETWVRSLGWEDPLKKGKATHSSTLSWRIGVAKSQTQLIDFHFHYLWIKSVSLPSFKKKNFLWVSLYSFPVSPTPNPWKPLVSFAIIVLPVLELPGITQSFVSGPFHLASCLWESSTFLGNSTVLFVAKQCSALWMDHRCFIHSLADGHLGCFQFVAVISKATTDLSLKGQWGLVSQKRIF